MNTIPRDFEQASRQSYDLIIIGGGIYGVSLAMMASEQGLNNLLVEKNDFGWATTYNHLRTVHGGLRYLQNLDLPRFFESVAERKWFLKTFPGLVKPLPCLMPLYGNGPYRPSVFKVALGLNDLLSRNKNKNVPAGQELPGGRVISAQQVADAFPLVDQTGLKGGAVWYDGGMPHAQLVISEMLKRACAGTTQTLNYTKAEELIVTDQQVQGVRCRDQETGQVHEFRSPMVVNAAGPWCRTFAAGFDTDDENLFRYSIAWNVLFNRKALSSHSVAVKPKRPGSRMYFIHGFNNLIMGGTIHAPWPDVTEIPVPNRDDIAAYIDDLNLSIPGLHLKQSDVLQVYAGLLPVQKQGTDKLSVREIIKDHGVSGGPRGAYSVSGVKLTTARLVAEKVLQTLFPGRSHQRSATSSEDATAKPVTPNPIFSFSWRPDNDSEQWRERLLAIIADQSVVHLDDLVIRRTTIGDNPQRALTAAPTIATLFEWDEQRRNAEIERLQAFFGNRSGNGSLETSAGS